VGGIILYEKAKQNRAPRILKMNHCRAKNQRVSCQSGNHRPIRRTAVPDACSSVSWGSNKRSPQTPLNIMGSVVQRGLKGLSICLKLYLYKAAPLFVKEGLSICLRRTLYLFKKAPPSSDRNSGCRPYCPTRLCVVR